MRRILEDAAQRAIAYLENLDSRGVAPSRKPLQIFLFLTSHYLKSQISLKRH